MPQMAVKVKVGQIINQPQRNSLKDQGSGKWEMGNVKTRRDSWPLMSDKSREYRRSDAWG